MADMVDQTGNPLTVGQLAKAYGYEPEAPLTVGMPGILTEDEQLDDIETMLGVKRGPAMGHEEALKETNPRYFEGPEYQKNCQRCVPTYELRRRGYPVETQPVLLGSTGNPMNPLWGYEGFDGVTVFGASVTS